MPYRNGVTLTEVRQTLRREVIVVAWLSTSVVSFHARVLSAQTPGVPDSAQWAAIRNSVWQSVYYRTFDSVVISAKVSRLRSLALAKGHREVRIWVGGGLGSVQDVYRFVDDRGHVFGELIHYGASGEWTAWTAPAIAPEGRTTISCFRCAAVARASPPRRA